MGRLRQSAQTESLYKRASPNFEKIRLRLLFMTYKQSELTNLKEIAKTKGALNGVLQNALRGPAGGKKIFDKNGHSL
jgi:hypothetical protein